MQINLSTLATLGDVPTRLSLAVLNWLPSADPPPTTAPGVNPDYSDTAPLQHAANKGAGLLIVGTVAVFIAGILIFLFGRGSNNKKVTRFGIGAMIASVVAGALWAGRQGLFDDGVKVVAWGLNLLHGIVS
jgi:hypothetical protein